MRNCQIQHSVLQQRPLYENMLAVWLYRMICIYFHTFFASFKPYCVTSQGPGRHLCVCRYCVASSIASMCRTLAVSYIWASRPISLKCVAKITSARDAMNSSAILHANARPSVVEVDLPSSSTRISVWGDAACSPSRVSWSVGHWHFCSSVWYMYRHMCWIQKTGELSFFRPEPSSWRTM